MARKTNGTGPKAPKAPRAGKKAGNAAVTIAAKGPSVALDKKPGKDAKHVTGHSDLRRDHFKKQFAAEQAQRDADAAARISLDGHAGKLATAAGDKMTRDRVALSIPRLRACLLIAPKKDEQRKFLVGVHLRADGEYLNMVATDGQQMLQCRMTSSEPWPEFLTGDGITLERNDLANVVGYLHKESKETLADQLVLEYAKGANTAWIASKDGNARFCVAVRSDKFPDFAVAIARAAESVTNTECTPLDATNGIAPAYMKMAGQVAAVFESKGISVYAPQSKGQGWVLAYSKADAVLHVVMPTMGAPALEKRTLAMLGVSNLKGSMAALRATITMKERAVKDADSDKERAKHQEVLDSVRTRLKAIEDALADTTPKLAGPKPEKAAKKARKSKGKTGDTPPAAEPKPAAPVEPAVH